MNAIDEVTASLKPAVAQLVEHLEISNQPQALAFFQQVLVRMDQVEDEDDLLALFLLLSTTAFQGFQLDPVGAMLAEHILAYAEQTAHTFSASDSTAH